MTGSLGGVLAVLLAGLSNGSFPAPSKRITVWRWEHVWFVYSLTAMIIFPLGLAALLGHNILAQLSSAQGYTVLRVGTFGLLWGFGSVLFGLSLVRLGMAITNALISGLVAFFGSLGPFLLGTSQISRSQVTWLVLSEGLLATSLALCAWASIARDRAANSAASANPQAEGKNAVVGVLIAVAAGCLSSMLNFGFAGGEPLARAAREAGNSAVLSPLAIWIPVLLGGAIPNLGYPILLIVRGKSWRTFSAAPTGNSVRAALMACLWFGAIWLYGYGAPLMGASGSIYGWAMIVGSSILTSNIWGAFTGEWKDAPGGVKRLFWTSTALLIVAVSILAAHTQPQ